MREIVMLNIGTIVIKLGGTPIIPYPFEKGTITVQSSHINVNVVGLWVRILHQLQATDFAYFPFITKEKMVDSFTDPNISDNFFVYFVL